MSHDELEKLIKKYLELDSASQAKISSMVYNWESLGGNEELDTISSEKMDNMVSQSNDCWRTDIDEFWIVFKDYNGSIRERNITAAKYGLHRMLLSTNDIIRALRLIRKGKNRHYKIPSKRALTLYFKDDSNYLKKKVSRHEKYMGETGNQAVRTIHENFIMKYENARHLRGFNPYELHRFYLAQFLESKG